MHWLEQLLLHHPHPLNELQRFQTKIQPGPAMREAFKFSAFCGSNDSIRGTYVNKYRLVKVSVHKHKLSKTSQAGMAPLHAEFILQQNLVENDCRN